MKSVQAVDQNVSIGVIKLLSRFVPESIRWLRLNGRIEDARTILKRIARFNSKDVNYIDVEEIKDEPFQGLKYILDLFRPRTVAVQSLIHGYAWFVPGILIKYLYVFFSAFPRLFTFCLSFYFHYLPDSLSFVCFHACVLVCLLVFSVFVCQLVPFLFRVVSL